MNKAEISNIQ